MAVESECQFSLFCPNSQNRSAETALSSPAGLEISQWVSCFTYICELEVCSLSAKPIEFTSFFKEMTFELILSYKSNKALQWNALAVGKICPIFVTLIV